MEPLNNSIGGLYPATSRRVTAQRTSIPLLRRGDRRSLTGWLPRQQKRHSARSRRIQRGTGPCDFAQGDGAAGDWTLRLRAG